MNAKAATVKAGVSRVGKFHSIWLVPIVAFVIGVWMVYAHWASQGPVIEISFESAEGIAAGNTKVKTKNVEIGEDERMHELETDLTETSQKAEQLELQNTELRQKLGQLENEIQKV